MTRGDCDLEQEIKSVLAGMAAVIKEFDDMKGKGCDRHRLETS